MAKSKSIKWQGSVTGIQPRIKMTRSFDQRQHSYLGYNLTIAGTIGDSAEEEFVIAISDVQQAYKQIKAGDTLSGSSCPVADPRREVAEFYRTSKLKVIEKGNGNYPAPPPFLGIAPELKPVYRQRGHRRLAARTYDTHCKSCIWGCRMAVEMIIDHWNPSQKQYRFETFCYGPISCRLYSAGPKRIVPGRKGMRYVEEDWVDDEETSHRGMDE